MTSYLLTTRSLGMLVVIVSAFGLAKTTRAVDLVVPDSSALVEGVNNTFPFAASTQFVHYQEVYSASQFNAISPNGGTISSMAFRANQIYSAVPITYALTVSLSTTTQAVDGLNADFTSNVGPDNAVVYSFPYSISQSFAAGTPWPFTIIVTFMHSFFYNPTNGNLLVDMQVHQTHGDPFTGPLVDVVNVSGGAVSHVSQATVYEPVAAAGAGGMVTEFGVVPVAPLQPYTTSARMSGYNFVAAGTGAAPGLVYYVLSTTNLSQPLTNWACVGTNGFDSNGNFAFTNLVDQTLTQQFYRIQIQ